MNTTVRLSADGTTPEKRRELYRLQNETEDVYQPTRWTRGHPCWWKGKGTCLGNLRHVEELNETVDVLALSLDLEEWSNNENHCSTTGNTQRNMKQCVMLLQLSQRATAVPNGKADALAPSLDH
jgi:hypothetical protein